VDGKTQRVSALRMYVPTDMLPILARQLSSPANADTDLVGDLPGADADIPLLVN
jgi:hypothetical protein